jgi:hypothetical protein
MKAATGNASSSVDRLSENQIPYHRISFGINEMCGDRLEGVALTVMMSFCRVPGTAN